MIKIREIFSLPWVLFSLTEEIPSCFAMCWFISSNAQGAWTELFFWAYKPLNDSGLNVFPKDLLLHFADTHQSKEGHKDEFLCKSVGLFIFWEISFHEKAPSSKLSLQRESRERLKPYRHTLLFALPFWGQLVVAIVRPCSNHSHAAPGSQGPLGMSIEGLHETRLLLCENKWTSHELMLLITDPAKQVLDVACLKAK